MADCLNVFFPQLSDFHEPVLNTIQVVHPYLGLKGSHRPTAARAKSGFELPNDILGPVADKFCQEPEAQLNRLDKRCKTAIQLTTMTTQVNANLRCQLGHRVMKALLKIDFEATIHPGNDDKLASH